jgi:hypothetical protein
MQQPNGTLPDKQKGDDARQRAGPAKQAPHHAVLSSPEIGVDGRTGARLACDVLIGTVFH